MKKWTKDIDPETIPADVLRSQLPRVLDEDLKRERARRNASRRRTYTGGLLWKKHNPNTSRCRCQRCTRKRQSRQY